MEDHSPSESEIYPGAVATPDLVGREAELAQINAAIRDIENSYIIYIIGAGGRGKTRLVQYVLRNPPIDVPVVAATDVVDLYHTRVHSLVGFITELLKLVPQLATFIEEQLESSPDKEQMLEKIGWAEQEGLSRAEALSRSRDLVQLIAQFTKQHRLVLCFDTTERLMMEQDPIQQLLKLDVERALLLEWLLNDFLPNVSNIVVLWAGRPDASEFKRLVDKQSGNIRSLSIDLMGLTEDKISAYIEAVTEEVTQRENPASARLIREALPPEQQHQLFTLLCDETSPSTVRPILLAIAIDRLSKGFSEQVVPKTNSPKQFGHSLIDDVMEMIKPADKAIVALGWLRKGADVRLLSSIIERSENEVQAALQKISTLSFIKIRKTDHRIFLHDEMYDLVWEYGLSKQEWDQERVYKAVGLYYKQRIRESRKEIADLYADESPLPDHTKVANARADLEDALVEDVYYRLRADALDGFLAFYTYAEEAIASDNQSLDMQLRAEMLAFLAEVKTQKETAVMSSLCEADVIADSAIRWIKRLINAHLYDKAIEVAQHLHNGSSKLITAGDEWAKIELLSWEALAWAYNGELDKANELLTEASSILPSFLSLEENDDDFYQGLEGLSVRQQCIAARLYNNWGYTQRALGYYYSAITKYEKSYHIWRKTGIRIEIANTLNNTAFVYAEMGWFDDARRWAEEGLERRRKLGPRIPVGLSFNTLAHIAIREGKEWYSKACEYAKKALDLFEKLEDHPRMGLALIALSEALRRMGEQENDEDLLKNAIERAEKAVAIFVESKSERAIEALIELGCAYRDQAKVMRGPHPPKKQPISPDVAAVALLSEQTLEKAVELAEQNPRFLHYKVNALVNLAWLKYYILDDNSASDRLNRAQSHIPESYYIKPVVENLGGLPTMVEDNVIVPFLVQLGRIELLRGQIAFNDYESTHQESVLDAAMEHYTLSLAYDTLFPNQSSRDMHRGLKRIQEHISDMDLDLGDLLRKVKRYEEKYGLGSNSTMKRFLKGTLRNA